MSSTSQKHKDFVAEPMGEKTVMALAGIGEVLGKRLDEKGFDKVWFTKMFHIYSVVMKLWLNFSFTFIFLPIGICCSRTVPGPEERWGVVSGMVEGYVWSQHQTARRLLWLSERVVWLFPVVDFFLLYNPPRIHLPHSVNSTFWTSFLDVLIWILRTELSHLTVLDGCTCNITAHFVSSNFILGVRQKFPQFICSSVPGNTCTSCSPNTVTPIVLQVFSPSLFMIEGF